MSIAAFDSSVLDQAAATAEIEAARHEAGDDRSPSRLLTAKASLALGRRQAFNDWRTSLPLVALDGLSAIAAGAAGCSVQFMATGRWTPTLLVGVVATTLLFQFVHRLYPACGLSYSLEFRSTLRTCFFVLAGVGFALALTDLSPDVSFEIWTAIAITLTGLLAAVRPIARHRLGRFDWWAQPVLVIGSNGRATDMHRRLMSMRHEGLRAGGIVFDRQSHWVSQQHPAGDSAAKTSDTQAPDSRPADDPDDATVLLGPVAELESILADAKACRIAVTDQTSDAYRDFQQYQGIPHVMLPAGFGNHPAERVRLAEINGQIELHCHSALTNPHALFAKRSLDLFLVIAASPFWLPLMALIVVMMKSTDPGPIFYRQRRVGRFGRPFQAVKFRSMVPHADRRLVEYLESHPELRAEWDATHKLKNDPRVTKIGEFLRKTSLDELPQLFNVWRGEMSLVGPRPIIDCSSYDREYIEDHPDVFELYQMVRPGITGMWQVSGRNHTSYKQRVYYDRFYLHNWTLALDVFILWRTVKTALFREGAC